jgi:hypothetical protein
MNANRQAVLVNMAGQIEQGLKKLGVEDGRQKVERGAAVWNDDEQRGFFRVRILFSANALSLYLLFTVAAMPHLAEPCSSRRRQFRSVEQYIPMPSP